MAFLPQSPNRSAMLAQILNEDPQYNSAQAAMQAGSSTAPVQSPLEGLARALQGAAGGFFAGQARGRAQDRMASQQATLEQALRAGTGWKNPDTLAGPGSIAQASYDATAANIGGMEPRRYLAPGEQGMPGDRSMMYQVLAGNPDTAQYGFGLMAQDMEKQQEISARRAEKAFDREYEGSPEALRIAAEKAKATRDPNAGVPAGYARTPDGQLAFIPGGPADPKVIAGNRSPSEQGGGMFGGSAEARAVQYLVTTGQLTPQQAAQWLAGKTAVGPNGQFDFVTPQAMVGGGLAGQFQEGSGGVTAIRPANQAKPTEGQSMAGGYASRMERAEGEMERLQGGGFNATNFWEALKGDIPRIGNYMVSSEFQQHRQAQADWVRAKLRKESGAVIGAEEMTDEIRTYFPQPGDIPAVVEQKARARKTAIEAMRQQSGPAAPAPQPALDAGDWDILELFKK